MDSTSPSMDASIEPLPGVKTVSTKPAFLWTGQDGMLPDELFHESEFEIQSHASTDRIRSGEYAGVLMQVRGESDLRWVQELCRLPEGVQCPMLVISDDPGKTATQMESAGLRCDDFIAAPVAASVLRHKLRFLAASYRMARSSADRLARAETLLEREVQLRQKNQEKSQLYARTIAWLSRSRALADGELKMAIQDAARAAAEGLEAEHSTVWIFSEDYSSVRCVGRYRSGLAIECSRDELAQVDFPGYFSALEGSRVCGVSDTLTDKRGRELAEGRGPEPPVRAFLVATFNVRGQKVGVLRVDDLHRARAWSTEDEAFLSSLADILALAFEVSERRRAEEALRLSEQKLRLLLENAREFAFLILDGQGIFRECNSGAEAMLGYREMELAGKFSGEIFSGEDRKAGVPELELERAKKDGRTLSERWHCRKDGSKFWGSGFVYALTDPTGVNHGFLKIIRDITERKLAEERMESENEALEERIGERTVELKKATDQMEGFCYTISHDLRAPLRSMQSFSTILLQDYASTMGEEGRNLLKRIQASAERMDALINDLLDYSRVARLPVPNEESNMEEIVREVLKDLEAPLREANAEVFVQHPLPVVCGNRATLIHVVSNLLTNAAKFTRGGVPPQIRIYTEDRGEWARLCVQDNGIGIAPEHRDRIFRIFERLHRADEYPGTGVGLAIVAKSIERLGGRTAVDSTLGKGSTFWFELKKA